MPEGSVDVTIENTPTCKKIISNIRNAFLSSKEAEDLGGQPKFGLLKFFSKGTTEDKRAYFAREDERAVNAQSMDDYHAKNNETDRKGHERGLAKLCQKERRQLLKEQEIRTGVRSPGGTKRKV